MIFPSNRGTSACIAALILQTAACKTQTSSAADSSSDVRLATAATDTARIAEAYVTQLDTAANVDSPALYGANGQYRLVATAKTADALIVYDAATGRELRRVGGTGRAPGRLDRPNGIVALDDSLLLVVERDNARVQAFRLPGFEPLGTFGERLLLLPYGIAAFRDRAGSYAVYVTDNYETADGRIPPLRDLARRVKQFEVRIVDGAIRARHVRSFGDTTAAGALRIVESIHADPAFQRLLIAEELETDSHVKAYSLDGRYLGETMGRGLFPQQAEGLALYACGDSAGYWVATDQGPKLNTFHLFDRRTLRHLASFAGTVTNTTDGVALIQRSVGPFAAGLFVASHADGGIAAFSWTDVSRATAVRADCTTR